jgi:ubiquinone biosynthesis protein
VAFSLGQRIKNSIRAQKIIRILLKYGFRNIVDRLSLGRRFVLRIRSGGTDNGFRLQRSVRIRQAIEELGPTYVKFGQLLSNRADLLPTEIIQEYCLFISSVFT